MTIKHLKGSPYRDAVKHWHKTLPNDLYVCDIDLALISFDGESVKAILDVKSRNDHKISTTHERLYDWFIKQQIPVFLITVEHYDKIYCEHCGKHDVVIAEDSDVTITEYTTGESRTMSRDEYIEWERGGVNDIQS